MNDQNATPSFDAATPFAPGIGDAREKRDRTIRIGESNGKGAYAWQEVSAVLGPDGKPVLRDDKIQWEDTGRHGTLEEHAAWELNHNPHVPLGLVVTAWIEGDVPTLYFQSGTC